MRTDGHDASQLFMAVRTVCELENPSVEVVTEDGKCIAPELGHEARDLQSLMNRLL